MILALRERHRRMFASLGILLPIAFVVGIAARKPVPGADSLPEVLTASPQQFAATGWARRDLFEKGHVQVRLLRAEGSGRFAVTLSAGKDFVKPDLLVYWVAGSPSGTDKLPDRAMLLGSFSTSTLVLPAEASTTEGSLVLFSLADQEIVDVSRPFATKQN